MKAAPQNKTRTMVLSGIAVAAAAVAGYLIFRPAGEAPPDEDAQAAIERSNQIQNNMRTSAPAAELPVESRAARGAVAPK